MTLNREKLLELAKEAGCVLDQRYKGEVAFISNESLDRFASLVLSAAQEEMAPAGIPPEVSKRTEEIRLLHANPSALTRRSILHHVECLLSHVAMLSSLKRPLQAQEQSASGAVDDLPPLPIATHCPPYPGPDDAAFTADQMREYGRICRAQAAHQAWACAASNNALPEPTDCDWPFCGCDPHANKVIEALQEGGVLNEQSAHNHTGHFAEDCQACTKNGGAAFARAQAAQQAQPVSDENGNLPCPFCGGKCDPDGWYGQSIEGGVDRRGPECEQCGGTADTIEQWNSRALLSQSAAQSEQETIVKGRITSWIEDGKECVGEQPAAQTAVPEGFALVPTDLNSVVTMGWAYLDKAREDSPMKEWAFSPAGFLAALATAPSPQGGDKQ